MCEKGPAGSLMMRCIWNTWLDILDMHFCMQLCIQSLLLPPPGQDFQNYLLTALEALCYI